MLSVGARAHDYGRQTPKALFAAIAKDQFSCVMLAVQKAILNIDSYFDVTPETIQNINCALRQSHLELQTLGVYMELSLCDEKKRRDAVSHFVCGMGTAKNMGISQVASETTSLHTQPTVSSKEAYASLLRSLEEILPIAENMGITVCLEPVYHHTLATPEIAKEVIDTMRSQALKLVFDPVNLLSPTDCDDQYTMWKRVRDCMSDHIALVHMKGVTRTEGGGLKGSSFAQSLVDYSYLFEYLKTLKKPLQIIREEVSPETASADAAFLLGFI